jgi:hypothetical protein
LVEGGDALGSVQELEVDPGRPERLDGVVGVRLAGQQRDDGVDRMSPELGEVLPRRSDRRRRGVPERNVTVETRLLPLTRH